MADATKTRVGERHGLSKFLLQAVPPAASTPAVSPPAGFTMHATAPGAWLMVGEADAGNDAFRPGYDAANDLLTVDLSAAYAVVRVTGPHARDVVAKGAAIDLHDSVFAPAASTVCRFGTFRVLLHRAEVDTYDLFVSCSLVEPFMDLITEYGAEFGIEHE